MRRAEKINSLRRRLSLSMLATFAAMANMVKMPFVNRPRPSIIPIDVAVLEVGPVIGAQALPMFARHELRWRAQCNCNQQRAAGADIGAVDGEDNGLTRRLVVIVVYLFLLGAGREFFIQGPERFDPAPGSLRGRAILITGGNRGLGKESAVRLARAGATVVLTARTNEKGSQAVAEVQQKSGSSDVHHLQLDLADLSSIRRFRAIYEAQPYGSNLDVLMNNAGIMALPDRQETKDGFERQFGVNHLGHFALVTEMLPLLRRGPGSGRVINVSSASHLDATQEDLEGDFMSPNRYTQWGPYCQSKLANVLFAKELDRRCKSAGAKVTAVSCNPGAVLTDLQRYFFTGKDDPNGARGMVANNPFVNALGRFVTRDLDRGANAQVYLAAAADGGYDKSGGCYFENTALGEESPLASDENLARQLWIESERLVGMKLRI